jgi:hypothetical protein
MRSVHLIVQDLFLPEELSAEVCAGLHVPALSKLMARGIAARCNKPVTPEKLLGEWFGKSGVENMPIAAISAACDGLPQANWLRADPVNLRVQRDKILLSAVSPDMGEARQFCASLNECFVGRGGEFYVAHPQRWYLRLDEPPRIHTTPLPELFGCNIRSVLPTGGDAAHFHRIFNEVQMLLHAHPANEVREARGALPVNSVWLWGEGDRVEPLRKNYHSVSSDDGLVGMFSVASSTPFAAWGKQWDASFEGRQLLVWTGLRSLIQSGDLAAWREALQDFEVGYAQPLWRGLRSGTISHIKMEVLAGDYSRCFDVTRGATRRFWRRDKPLAHYSMV